MTLSTGEASTLARGLNSKADFRAELDREVPSWHHGAARAAAPERQRTTGKDQRAARELDRRRASFELAWHGWESVQDLGQAPVAARELGARGMVARRIDLIESGPLWTTPVDRGLPQADCPHNCPSS